jgi:hypothetical protein
VKVREGVTQPMANYICKSVFPHPQTKEQLMRFDRPTMLRRVRDSIASIYNSSIATLSAQCLTYPFESVRLRVESQYAVAKLHNNVAPYSGFFNCVKQVYIQEGIAGFYRGFYYWALQIPLAIVWPVCAGAAAALLVHLIFEDETDDELDKKEQ